MRMTTNEAVSRRFIGLYNQVVSIEVPSRFLGELEVLFGSQMVREQNPDHVIKLSQLSSDFFQLVSTSTPQIEKIPAHEVPLYLMEAVVRDLVTDLDSGVALHSGAVSFGDRCALLCGVTRAGKSSLTAWMSLHGYDYLTDELIILSLSEKRAIHSFARSLTVRDDCIHLLERFSGFDRWRPRLVCLNRLMLSVRNGKISDPFEAGLIVFPQYQKGAELRIESVRIGMSALKLLEGNLNGRNLSDGGLETVTQLARTTPSISLTYGDFSQLEGIFDRLVRYIFQEEMSPRDCRLFLETSTASGEFAKGDVVF